MGKTFRKWTCYPLWEVKNEEKDLNVASKNGYQLVEGRAFWWTLEKNDTVRYTYQIDFNPGAKLDPRYKETFAEMGWEYVSSTFNGWHYFKKPYQEGQQLENGEVVQSERIYTDQESYKEMEKRWQKLGITLSVLCFFFSALYFVQGLIHVPALFGFAFGFLFFGASVLNSIMNYKKESEDPSFEPSIKIPFKIALPVFFGIIIVTFVIGFFCF